MRTCRRILSPLPLLVYFTLVPLITATAQPIFQWTDSAGQVHYSTKPTHPESKPKELPKVGREDLDKKIKAIKEDTPENCTSHGGIDCSRGADSDGSVICLDGDRGAVMPFQFHCMEARVQADFSVVMDPKAPELFPHSRNLLKKLEGRKPAGLNVNVRNLSGVAAFGLQVEFKLGRKQLVPAVGPDRIEPFGNAGYTLLFDTLPEEPNLSLVEQADFNVVGTNFAAVIRA